MQPTITYSGNISDMQLQFSALRPLFSLCGCTCPIFPGILLNMHLQPSKIWKLTSHNSLGGWYFRKSLLPSQPWKSSSQKDSFEAMNLACFKKVLCIWPCKDGKKVTLTIALGKSCVSVSARMAICTLMFTDLLPLISVTTCYFCSGWTKTGFHHIDIWSTSLVSDILFPYRSPSPRPHPTPRNGP